ncbi:MAG: hypothetical protein ACI8Q6_003682, partial [Granulosicoccus sp.]
MAPARDHKRAQVIQTGNTQRFTGQNREQTAGHLAFRQIAAKRCIITKKR